MKGKDSLNLLPPPESLNDGATQEQASQNNAEPQRPPKQKARRKPTRSNRSGGTSFRGDRESQWHRIKGRLNARLQDLDKEKLKALLLACGVAAAIVAAVIIAIKLLPVMAVVLAALGLGAALRLWERVRYMPRPF